VFRTSDRSLLPRIRERRRGQRLIHRVHCDVDVGLPSDERHHKWVVPEPSDPFLCSMGSANMVDRD
jgi:hypothetical protein